jgi:hypothetical protein
MPADGAAFVASKIDAIAAYSEPCRSAFRGDGDRDSDLMPITIPI